MWHFEWVLKRNLQQTSGNIDWTHCQWLASRNGYRCSDLFLFFKTGPLAPSAGYKSSFQCRNSLCNMWSGFNCHEVTRSKPASANSVSSPASFDGKKIGIYPPFQTGSKFLKSSAGSSTDFPAHLFLWPWLPGGRATLRNGALRRKPICLRGDPAQSGPPWDLSDGGMSVAPRRMIDFLENTKNPKLHQSQIGVPKCIGTIIDIFQYHPWR